MYQFEISTENWKRLPSCPYTDSGLVVLEDKVTTVGGWDGSCTSKKLFALTLGSWVEEYPAMHTERTRPAAVSTPDGNQLIVVGGYVGGSTLATVEIYQVNTRAWYKLQNLPQPLRYPSAIIFKDHFIVHGIDGNGYYHPILSSAQLNSSKYGNWKSIPPPPVEESALSALRGQLIIIGGRRRFSTVKSIYQLVGRKWKEIGSMSSERRMCLVVSLTTENIMVVGGIDIWDSVDSIEIVY